MKPTRRPKTGTPDWEATPGSPTVTVDTMEAAVVPAEEEATLPVPEHLHRLWLALGLEDE